MQDFHRAITMLAFAAHALLGCGVHYTCQHGIVAAASKAHDHAEHDCVAHHHDCDDSHVPANEHPCPATSCDHEACSFVKVDHVRIDVGASQLAFAIAAMPAELPHSTLTSPTANETLSSADLSSTQLYVWHCALLI